MPKFNALTNAMILAANQAAKPLLRDFGEVEKLQVARKGPADFVSIADKRTQSILVEQLSEAFPNYGFILEEGDDINADKNHVFIIDPLDGTTNFLHGIPHFAISIAAQEHGKISNAVIYDPVKNEVFVAEKGRGAFMNDQRLRVSGRGNLDNCLFATGIPFLGHGDAQAKQKFIGQLTNMMDKTAGVRRMGAASLDLAYVAAGRYDGYWEANVQVWDIAAGIAIVQEAGGNVTDFSGRSIIRTQANSQNSIDPKEVVAANFDIHQDFLELL